MEGLMVKTVVGCVFFMGPADRKAAMTRYDIQALGGRRIAYRPCAMSTMRVVRFS
jgi:hypothetical protein